MNLPPGAVFAYSYDPEAWYWPAVASDPRTVPDIVIKARYAGDGVEWEFVEWEFMVEDDGSGEVRLSRCLSREDLELPRAQVPELFAAMAELRPRTLEEVRALLDLLGAADVTKRTRG